MLKQPNIVLKYKKLKVNKLIVQETDKELTCNF